MTAFRSKSFSLLVATGLLVVSLPLIIVLASSDMLMGRLAKHSSLSVYRSVTGSQLSQKLIEHVLNQERRVRQYQVLGDTRLLEEVTSVHAAMLAVAQGLAELPYGEEEKKKITTFLDLERKVFTAVVDTTPEQLEASGALNTFAVMNRLAREISHDITQHTFDEIASFQEEASRAKSLLFWQALTLIPLTGGLIFLMAQIISRPITQIDSEIQRLGKGDFSTPIFVSGPDDLVALGKRLDWLREKLVSFEKDKSRFAAHISHELKTPLASIREGVELLGDEVAGPITENQQDIIEILGKNALQLQGLIENLVGYTMAQAQQATLNVTQFSLETLMEKVLVPYKPLLLKKDIQVDIDVAGLTLSGDFDRLLTVFDNLLSNAVKYSAAQGTIKIAALKRGARVIVDFIDSGAGIAPEDAGKIFNPFYQGRPPEESSMKGTGLGLAIVKEYIVAHGGDIERIDEPNTGAHFRLTIPA